MSRKIIATFVGIMLAVASTNASYTVLWQDNIGSAFYNSGANLLSGDLTMQLWIDDLNNTTFSQFAGGNVGIHGDGGTFAGAINTTANDDILLASATWGTVGGLWGSSFQSSTALAANAGDHFYFRWFLGGSQVSATQAGFIYISAVSPAVPWVIPGEPDASIDIALTYGPGNPNADVTGTQNAGNGWESVAPIPEPTSLALFGLGGLLIGLRRKLRKD